MSHRAPLGVGLANAFVSATRWMSERIEHIDPEHETPLRAELFSADQMEQHGKVLADTHLLSRARTRHRLLKRLNENEQQLVATCSLLTTAVKTNIPVAPAGAWLLDNFYLIEEQIRTARNHLPTGYSKQLPRLKQGPSRGLPRVYDLALEAISHGDGHLDSEILGRFVASYQTVTPLTLGELWAIPIMLRLALIENLRRVSVRISLGTTYVNLAEDWADQMITIAESDPKSLILVIADMARSEPPMVSAFVAELARRLQGRGPALALSLTWIEQRLAESSQTIEQLVLSENQQQAADQVSISNTIGSLRFLGATDWREFVETMSFVERVFLEDYGGVYRQMDFATRDRYRHVVDVLARHSPLSEIQIAREAITLAHRAAATGCTDQTAHVGYYLIGAGLGTLERSISARPTMAHALERILLASPLALYVGAIALITEIFAGQLTMHAYLTGVAGWRLALLCVLLLFAGSQLGAAIVNWVATLLIDPKRLPRMDYSLGIPVEARTLVVVPSMITSVQNIDELLESLEVRYLGNRDEHIHFALLTDFRDAATEVLVDDELLLRQAGEGISALNERHSASNGDRFYLFHRPRLWNPSQGVWMGHERKRGKLADLNALLRGKGTVRFSSIIGDTEILEGIRYVITLDADTQLPRDSARQMVGTLAHPLNRAHYDERLMRVTSGYGILQPRVAASLIDPERSRYAQLCGSEPGIDPYTRSVSDVYQDLFAEGSFIGKGIYDVDTFERALADRFPDNRILSHDLLEGCYARSGLVSDVSLFEEYPSRYETDVSRQWRWIRGDWQIGPWLWPRVPGPAGKRLKNPLSSLSRWKILDNLRRPLASGALLLLFALAWLMLPQSGLWTLAAVGTVLVPPLLIHGVDVLRRPDEVRWRHHISDIVRSALRHLGLAAFRIATLPHEALFSLDAILRTLWRTLVTHRDLLEWSASGENVHRPSAGLVGSFSSLSIAPICALGAAAAIMQLRPAVLLDAAPILGLWFFAPVVTWWLGRPLSYEDDALTDRQLLFLRRTARKTWSFFERFVGEDDHWLPPDNFQEHPAPIVAHRTSPTNMGLSLLANLAACDFGYISARRLIERTTHAFDTMAKLERYEGHFYNWYDTVSLQPLPPRYISSVDSGNLAGHLVTLRAGLLALPGHRVVNPRLFEGLADTLAILTEVMPEAKRSHLRALDALVSAACALHPESLVTVVQRLERLENAANEIRVGFRAAPDAEAEVWTISFLDHCEDALSELRLLVPWLALPAAPEGLGRFVTLGAMPSLEDLVDHAAQMLPHIDAELAKSPAQNAAGWLTDLRRELIAGADAAGKLLVSAEHLAQRATAFASADYTFLYDSTRHLLAIGYNVDEFRRDTSFYDLLASEARLSTFVAIAQGQLPQESWFALGRSRTNVGGDAILVSWSGSMFEYLMPILIMPSYTDSLLDQTYRAAVARQIAFGNQRSLPWGVSESGYNTVDASLNYQYRAFGVPGLGLKRGLADDSVVTPYASALALMVAPDAACENLQRLAAMGMEGRFGFYEAIDFTPSRLGRGQTSVIIRSFMAHHQGMVLLSLAQLLLDRPMQRRFESDPFFQATLLLLQERVPKNSAIHAMSAVHADSGATIVAPATSARAPIGSDTSAPEVNLLSNGRYHVMVTNAGGGYTRWKDLAVTRWREDTSCDNWGAFVYLSDVATGEYWSATHQPTLKRAESYAATFSEGRAEYRRRDHDYETYSEIVVSPEDDIDVRRIRITNHARVPRTIEVTSYAEVVLASSDADAMQTAFSNLFVQTEILSSRRAILCTRRPRSLGEQTPWMFHLLATHGRDVGDVSYETDRMKFIGRGQTVAEPRAIVEVASLSGNEGSVLDPIVAIRCRIALDAGQSATVDFVSGAADSRDACKTLVEKYQDRHLADRVFDVAWTHGGVVLRQINATESDAQLYTRLAGSVLYPNPSLRADPATLLQNRRGQSGLWGYSISGDLPIVLLRIGDNSHMELARQMIQCHAYWRLRGLAVDLVIWNEDHNGYRQALQDQIMALIARGTEASAVGRLGGIFVRPAEQISTEDRILMQAVARAIIVDSRGSLLEQVNRRSLAEKKVALLVATRAKRAEPVALPGRPARDLILANDVGGFCADGTEYVITTTPAQMTPTPWVNVLANPQFGSVISESGLAYTWSENAHEFRMTPWSDDAVGASGGEAFYVRDEETGQFWSPAPLPTRGESPYVTRHGFGYSVFEHTSSGIRSELWVYVDTEDSVKFSVLKVRNLSGRPRRLSATGYVEWVLGDLRTKTAMHLTTEIDAASGALFARNYYSAEFASRVAFLDVDDMSRTLTGDRVEFLGRNGRLGDPDAMARARLSGRLGAGLDPCGAIQVPFDLSDGQEREIIFRLGCGTDIDAARKLVQRLRRTGSARGALQRVRQHWTRILGAIQIDTPDPALNVLANGWIVYQTLACRLWARSGYYQSGGAFGFRDQLQDAMALVHTAPEVLREQLLRCAGRQYPEGDVQHWWHPPSGRGVRTRCSDDYLWLPLAACRYVQSTADTGILDEGVYFLEGRLLGAEEESYYDQPGRSAEPLTFYEHCVRSVRHGLRFGEHGLPLMGSGDWNDGMNLVGIHGRGESVWLAFFLYDVLTSFARLAQGHGDAEFARDCQQHAEQLRHNIAEHGWDGAWYRRAYFDDGAPLGSSVNVECSIDSIAQSWSVLSGAGGAERSALAMEALDQRLVRRQDKLIELLAPPFDTSSLNPGYIKGYLPGVRENGGQYTHAAVWAAMAFAALGDSKRAWELLQMINPLNHCLTARAVATYKTEPYVVASDVYALAPHTGRGGWTWYTGSAGWLYRLIVESLLGLTLEGARLRIAPCLPEDWTNYSINYRYRNTSYRVSVVQVVAMTGRSVAPLVTLDGVTQADNSIALVDDQRIHLVEVRIERNASVPDGAPARLASPAPLAQASPSEAVEEAPR
jgi:cyclic beta-1,2-glucan synthetase